MSLFRADVEAVGTLEQAHGAKPSYTESYLKAMLRGVVGEGKFGVTNMPG